MIEVTVTGATEYEIIERALAMALQFYPDASEKDLVVEPFRAHPFVMADGWQVLQWEADVGVWYNR